MSFQRTTARIEGDPHFTAPSGLHYDFNGIPGRFYCLVSDERFQLNALLDGFYDDRSGPGTYEHDNKPMGRCWMREIGLLWRYEDRVHTLRLVARTGSEEERKEGFMALVEVDGALIPRLQAGENHTANGLCLVNEGPSKEAWREMDNFRITLLDLLEMQVSTSIAHKLLRRPDDCWNHLNIAFEEMDVSASAHGLMGEMYRQDHWPRLEQFAKVEASIKAAVAADGLSGAGLLDGRPEDYETKTVTSSEFKFSVFKKGDAGGGVCD